MRYDVAVVFNQNNLPPVAHVRDHGHRSGRFALLTTQRYAVDAPTPGSRGGGVEGEDGVGCSICLARQMAVILHAKFFRCEQKRRRINHPRNRLPINTTNRLGLRGGGVAVDEAANATGKLAGVLLVNVVCGHAAVRHRFGQVRVRPQTMQPAFDRVKVSQSGIALPINTTNRLDRVCRKGGEDGANALFVVQSERARLRQALLNVRNSLAQGSGVGHAARPMMD